jgi:GABA(A) receptor-associated protein
MEYKFKYRFSFIDRQNESLKIMSQYPDRIPIICERSDLTSDDCPFIDKKKYLVPRVLNVAQFIHVIRKRMKISEEKALYLFIKGNIPSSSLMIETLYNYYRDDDGFLYVLYSFENTFG